jgi:hypothetical protein
MISSFVSPSKGTKKREQLALGSKTSSAEDMYYLIENHAYYSNPPFDFFQVSPKKSSTYGFSKPAAGCNYSFHCAAFKATTDRNEKRGYEPVDVCACSWVVGIKISRQADRKVFEVILFNDDHGPSCLLPPLPKPSLKFLLEISPIKSYAKKHRNKQLIAYVENDYKWIILPTMATDLKAVVKASAGNEQDIGYKGIHPWLQSLKTLKSRCRDLVRRRCSHRGVHLDGYPVSLQKSDHAQFRTHFVH